MNRLTSVILLMIILFGTFSSLFVLAEYAVNKTEIARSLCVNRNRPELNCNGACYLKIRLEKVQSSSDPYDTLPLEKSVEEKQELVYTYDFSLLTAQGKDENKEKTTFSYLNLYKFRFYEQRLIPPQA